MNISSLFMSIILFGMVFVGFGTLYSNFQSSYGINGTDLGGYYDYDNLNSTASEMGGSIKTGNTIVSQVVYIDGIVSTLKSLVDLPSTINTILVNVSNDIGLPTWFVNNVGMIVMSLVGFAIAGIIWRYKM